MPREMTGSIKKLNLDDRLSWIYFWTVWVCIVMYLFKCLLIKTALHKGFVELIKFGNRSKFRSGVKRNALATPIGCFVKFKNFCLATRVSIQ